MRSVIWMYEKKTHVLTTAHLPPSINSTVGLGLRLSMNRSGLGRPVLLHLAEHFLATCQQPMVVPCSTVAMKSSWDSEISCHIQSVFSWATALPKCERWSCSILCFAASRSSRGFSHGGPWLIKKHGMTAILRANTISSWGKLVIKLIIPGWIKQFLHGFFTAPDGIDLFIFTAVHTQITFKGMPGAAPEGHFWPWKVLCRE